MFNDFAFRDGVRLAGVNIINWARVLAQVVYYFYLRRGAGRAAPGGQLHRADRQFRRHLRGLHRAQDGPADRQAGDRHQPERHSATGRCATGDYRTDGVQPSISPSMDIQVSSNFERALFDAYGRDGAAVAALMAELKAGGFRISQGALQTPARDVRLGPLFRGRDARPPSRRTWRATGEVLCPHSAVGVKVAEEHLGADADDHAGHRASGEVPRCGGGRERHPPRPAAAHGRPFRPARTGDRACRMTLPRSRR